MYKMVQIIIPVTLDASAGAELFGERLEPLTDCSYAFQTVSCETLTAENLNELLYFTDQDSSDALFWVSSDGLTQDNVSEGINAEVSGTVLAIDTGFGSEQGIYTNSATVPSDSVLGEHYVQYVASLLFGHPQAQAPIKNDDSMISDINSSNIGQQFVQKLIDDVGAGTDTNAASESSGGVVKAVFEQLLSLAHERFDVSGDDIKGDHTDLAKKFRFETGDVIQFKVRMQGELSIEGAVNSLATSNSADDTAAAVFSASGVTYSGTGSSASVDARTWRVSLRVL
jgi:hypothetical protein